MGVAPGFFLPRPALRRALQDRKPAHIPLVPNLSKHEWFAPFDWLRVNGRGSLDDVQSVHADKTHGAYILIRPH